MPRMPWEDDEIVSGAAPWENDEIVSAPGNAAPKAPAKPRTLGEKVTEGLRYVIPSRVEYGEKHPGKNTIKGQIMGEDAEPSFAGQSGAYIEDAVSMPRRLWGGAWNLAKGDLAGAKRELQKTEGEGFIETLGREAPLMLIPGGQARGGAKIATNLIKKGAEAAEAALPLKAWIAPTAKELAAEAAQAVPALGRRALGGLKRLGTDLGARIGRGVAETAPQAAYHQVKSVQETGSMDGAAGAAELAGGGAVQVPIKALGALSRAMPQGAKWLMSQFSGANKDALQRASEKGGLEALKKVSGEGAADELADDLIKTLGQKDDLIHPEPKLKAEILPHLPRVQAVEPMTRRNTVAYSNGKEIPVDVTGRMEPLRNTPPRPSLKEMDELDGLRGDAEGLPAGFEKYENTARQFRKEAADRGQVAAVLGQTVKKALRAQGKIYVDDNMRRQLGLSGNRWKEAAGTLGLDMLTTDKRAGISLDRAAMQIAEDQGVGRWDGLPKIESEQDLLDALYEATGKKAARPSEHHALFDELIRTGRNLEGAEKVTAGSLKKGDMFTAGKSLFKVVKNADGQVVVDGPAKLILDSKDAVHFDAGSRISNEGEIFTGAGVAESMDIPEQGKVTFIKTLTRGRERFRDLLEQKTNETVRTPEKEKTLGKLRRLLDLADEQLEGRETLSALEADQFKMDYQDVLREQYKSRESDEYFTMYKTLARSLREGIEEAAEKSGNPEYITIMRNLANKLQVIDRVESRFAGDQITKAQDRAARQIKIINNEAQRPALKELQVLDNLFGTNFADRAKDVGFAKMLQMGEDGIPLFPLHTTGKALMGVSAGAGVYKANEGEINPLAVAGLLMSSPRLAMYAFKALDKGTAVAPRVGKTLGAALPRLQSTALYGTNKEDRKP